MKTKANLERATVSFLTQSSGASQKNERATVAVRVGISRPAFAGLLPLTNRAARAGIEDVRRYVRNTLTPLSMMVRAILPRGRKSAFNATGKSLCVRVAGLIARVPRYFCFSYPRFYFLPPAPYDLAFNTHHARYLVPVQPFLVVSQGFQNLLLALGRTLPQLTESWKRALGEHFNVAGERDSAIRCQWDRHNI